MTTPSHLLAYALSPKYYSVKYFLFLIECHHTESLRLLVGYKKALSRLFRNPNVASNVWREFAKFVSGKNADPDAINDQSSTDATGWWYLHGKNYIYLQPLAIKILLKVFSSSVAKQNWSTHSFIHSVKHNRFGFKKAEDLVYINSNLCLLSIKDLKYKKGPEKLWDVLPKFADLDMTIQDLARIALLDIEEDMAASGANGTGLGSNNQDLDIVASKDEAIDPSLFDDPFDP